MGESGKKGRSEMKRRAEDARAGVGAITCHWVLGFRGCLAFGPPLCAPPRGSFSLPRCSTALRPTASSLRLGNRTCPPVRVAGSLGESFVDRSKSVHTCNPHKAKRRTCSISSFSKPEPRILIFSTVTGSSQALMTDQTVVKM